MGARSARVGGGGGPRARGYPFLSLALLLVLVASPVASMGGTQPVLLGIGLTALTVCFLWSKPAAAAARPRHRRDAALRRRNPADKEEPWFDYRGVRRGLGPRTRS